MKVAIIKSERIKSGLDEKARLRNRAGLARIQYRAIWAGQSQWMDRTGGEKMAQIFKFDEQVIQTGIEAETAAEALEKIGAKLVEAGYVKNSYIAAIVEREKHFPTGLPTGENGVAIPHTDICHVMKPMIAVGILKEPVQFQNMGDHTQTVAVKIIFMLAMNHCDNQIKLLSAFMENLQDQVLLDQLANASSARRVAELMKGKISF